jgi:integrase
MARGITREVRGGAIRLKWRDPDKRARSWTVHSERAAVLLEEEIRASLDLGRRWEPRDACPIPRLAAALTAYTQRCARVLAPATAIRYARSLDLFLRHIDDDKAPVTVLSRASLEAFYAWLRSSPVPKRDHPRALSTSRKTVEHIHGAWVWLYDTDEYGPHVDRPRTIEMPDLVAPLVIAPTWEEADACVMAITHDATRVLATVLRYTGLRISQAMLLDWQDVDLEEATVHIRTGKSKQERRGRVIPISPHLVAYLSGLGTREGLVVPLAGDEVPTDRLLRPRQLVDAWERSGVRPEVWRGRTSHAFRRAFTTGLERAGAHADAVEYLVGHAAAKGARASYLDPTALPLRETVDLIPEIGASTLIRLRKPAKRRGK